jgi:hypothetical protein
VKGNRFLFLTDVEHAGRLLPEGCAAGAAGRGGQARTPAGRR